jgi:hypothetical protein
MPFSAYACVQATHSFRHSLNERRRHVDFARRSTGRGLCWRWFPVATAADVLSGSELYGPVPNRQVGGLTDIFSGRLLVVRPH